LSSGRSGGVTQMRAGDGVSVESVMVFSSVS
jgi:hypothetical protein